MNKNTFITAVSALAILGFAGSALANPPEKPAEHPAPAHDDHAKPADHHDKDHKDDKKPAEHPAK
jgi:hypothetical protein